MAGLRLLLEDSGGATELAWPGGVAASTRVAALHTRTSAINSAGMWAFGSAAQADASASALRRTWSASSATTC